MNERRAAAIAHHERGVGLVKRLYTSEAECHLRAQNHAECSRAGIVNDHQVRAHGDALLAQMKPIIDQVALTGPEIIELRSQMIRPAMTKAQSAARHEQFIENSRRPIYGTRKMVEAELASARSAAHASPALRQALNTGNAANSVTLGRALYRRTMDGEPILRKPSAIK